MYAVQFDGYGGPDVLRLNRLPEPQFESGQVIVDVHAVSMNPIDWKIRSGQMAAGLPITFPATTGRDGAGVVRMASDPTFIGKRVLFFAPRGTGTWAEQVALPTANVATLPDSISFSHAAGIPLAGTSAWIPLVDIAQVTRGTRVLIHAGAGGVGSIAIQIAQARGAEVITTCSSRNADFAKSLGANQVIEYDKTPFETQVRDVDVVFDTMGGDVHDKSYKVLKSGGHMLCLMAEPFTDRSAEYGVTVQTAPILARKEILESLASMVEAGNLELFVEHLLPITDFRRAHELSEAGRVRGKIVLALRTSDGTPIA